MTTRATATTQVMTDMHANIKILNAQTGQIIQALGHGHTQMSTINDKVDAGINRLKALEDRQAGTSNARLRAKHAPLCA